MQRAQKKQSIIERRTEAVRSVLERQRWALAKGKKEAVLMSDVIRFGRRSSDISLMVDFHKERAIVRANTSWIEGFELEKIEAGSNGFAPGMVLIHRNWDNVYFVNEREGWTDDQYFRLAESIFKKMRKKQHT